MNFRQISLNAMYGTVARSRLAASVLLAAAVSVSGQLREFDVQEMPATSCADAAEGRCAVIVESADYGLLFESTLGIEKQSTRSDGAAKCHLLQLLPNQRQKLRISAEKFKDTRVDIPRLGAGMCIRLRLTEKTAAAPLQWGACSITSSPSGAGVRIAELPTVSGETPLFLDSIPVGTYTVVLARTHYNAVTCTLSIENGDTAVYHIQLPRGGCCVAFVTDPPGADVYLDGVPAGTTPLETDAGTPFCTAGEHRYWISAPAFKTVEGTYTGAADSVVEISIDLMHRKGLSITVDPPDALIMINRKNYSAPVEDLDVPVGERCEIVVSRKGFETYRENLWVDKGDPVDRHVVLAPELTGEKKEVQSRLQKNLRPGRWMEVQGGAGATPMLLFTPGSPTGVAGSGIMLRTTAIGKIIFLNPDWAAGPYFGVSLFGEAMFHRNFFLIDAVGVQAGFKYNSRDYRHRVYVEVDFGLKLAGMTEHASEDAVPTLYVPLVLTGRYEWSPWPAVSLVAAAGGMQFAGVHMAQSELQPTYPTVGFLPFFGAGVRIHAGVLSRIFGTASAD